MTKHYLQGLCALALVIPGLLFAADNRNAPPQGGQMGGPMGGFGDGRPGGPGGGRDGMPPGPPQMFLDACKGRKDGDAVTLQNAQGQRQSGSCRIVWVPSGPPRGQGKQSGPPGAGSNNNNMPPPRQGGY